MGLEKLQHHIPFYLQILNCKEFVNADEIARGLSPFNVESAAIQAGKLMLNRINELLEKEQDFAFETTLSTKSYRNFVLKAQEKGYKVILLFFTLTSVELAIERVSIRVEEGGHNIPEEVIKRRYENGLKNFFTIFEQIVDEWLLVDNTGIPYQIIAQKNRISLSIENSIKWNYLVEKYK